MVFNNKINLTVFDTFFQQNIDKINNEFPYLDGLIIDIVDIKTQSFFNDNFSNVFSDPVQCLIEKENKHHIITSEIIYNESITEFLCINNCELLALIAHEIGHFVFYFKKVDEQINEEQFSDDVACVLGYKDKLKCALIKLLPYVSTISTNNHSRAKLIDELKNRILRL